ncbi:MAG: exonuclease SbcCD subunit D C-terminal domain-containing protein [Rectinemataceae bacterium]|nr:exonuclease SbcCD subunit D C-terminal domain-containing protein [Rectinemataceae bacterium]
MRILHTSDWHLGHTLHDVGRDFEHHAFLQWLVDQLRGREIDALLIAGDIFDTANPSAASQDLWFWFLAQALKARPGLQIVAIAGNHDSAARLEAPDHLLRQFDIRVVGSLPRRPDGVFDPEGVLVRLKDRQGAAQVIVVAMPFLRAGDLPVIDGEDPLIEGVRCLYDQACEAARPMELPIIALGHCYLVSGQISDLSERKVLGGNQHALPTTMFPTDVAYVGLGHLHLPQVIEAGRIRYSGSPIPLSMPERHYPHSVTILEFNSDAIVQQEQIRIPRALDLVRIPEKDFLPLEELLESLRGLTSRPSEEISGRPRPFLEVGVRLDKPEATLRTTIEAALDGKGYFLAKITPHYTGTGRVLGDAPHIHGLREITVEDVFRKKWERDYKTEPTSDHLSAIHELIDQVNQ